jgi:hypothetical protein
MHEEEIIPTFFTSNTYIALCLPISLTLALLEAYELFTNNQNVGLPGFLIIQLPRDVFLHHQARGISLKEGVQQPLQSLVRTPPHHLH